MEKLLRKVTTSAFSLLKTPIIVRLHFAQGCLNKLCPLEIGTIIHKTFTDPYNHLSLKIILDLEDVKIKNSPLCCTPMVLMTTAASPV